MTDHSQQKEYIINTGMFLQWRVGCIRAAAPFDPDNNICIGCEFDNKERGGCDFDDDEMQKIFQSNPHTSVIPIPIPATKLCTLNDGCDYCTKQPQFICSETVRMEKEEIAAKERERLLQEIHEKTILMRHQASPEESNNNVIVLDYARVYEMLQTLRGAP